MPLSLNPFRKKTPDELNPYIVEIDLSDSFIKKVRRVSPTSAKFVFSCKKPFPCNVKFKTFQLDSLKSHFKNNLFNFKKFKVYADFEKEDIDWLMENRELLEKTSRNSKGGLGQSLKNLSKKLRLNKIYKKIKKANQGFKYEGRRGSSKISFAYGGRHERKFIPLPRTVNLYCSTDFQQGYNLNIGSLRPMNSKDAAKKKENKLVFKSPELSKAIKKAIKYKVLGKPIKENSKYSKNSRQMKKTNSLKKLNEGGGAGYDVTIDFYQTKVIDIDTSRENWIDLTIEANDPQECKVQGYDWGGDGDCLFSNIKLSLNIPTMLEDIHQFESEDISAQDIIDSSRYWIGQDILKNVSFKYGQGWIHVKLPETMALNLYAQMNVSRGVIAVDELLDFEPVKRRNIESLKASHVLTFTSKELTDLVESAHNFENEETFEESKPMKNIKLTSLKEKISKKMECRKLKLGEGYSNNSKYFGDWFGKGQIDWSQIIDNDSDGDIYMVKIWSGRGYVMDVYLVRAKDIYDAMNKVFLWSYQNEGKNTLVFDDEHVNQTASIAYEDEPDMYGDEYIDDEEGFIDRFIEDEYVGSENGFYVRAENFFVDKVPEEVLKKEMSSGLTESEDFQISKVALLNRKGEVEEFEISKLKKILSPKARVVIEKFNSMGNPEMIYVMIREFLDNFGYDSDKKTYEEGTPTIREFEEFISKYKPEDFEDEDEDDDEDSSGRDYDDDDDDDEREEYGMDIDTPEYRRGQMRRDRYDPESFGYDDDPFEGGMGLIRMAEKVSPEKCKKDVTLQESISRLIRS